MFTFYNKRAILIVQEGEYPDISKTTIDIFGAVEFLVLYSTRKEALVWERVKRYEDYDLRKADDGPWFT